MEPPANEDFEPLEMNVPAIVHSSQTYEPQPGNEQPELGVIATMEELEQLPFIPTTTHTSEPPLVCDLVRMEDLQPQTVIMSPDKLALPVLDEVHWQLRPSSEKFICLWRGCKASFKKMVEFRLHVRSHTTEAQRCFWAACQRLPESRSSLNKHLDSHTKPHTCPQGGCRHRAAKLRDIERHILSHGTPNGAKVYYCPARDCQYSDGRTSFSRMDNAKRHIRQMHASSNEEVITRTHST
ncbi:hypothetical protein L207DRAFT_71660 [Hyaloscypha variabilis F]|uniref:C2H2-type domain-containing protein n=1 Tax=Hyaloscypha variabilis (strain UAMH 11265 / GT02V1 / F) TaxID=1149755 RepID=A0A2J6RF75_HYAVF|nr:hypothetical protein L207DRAFT_71660 [Hyaloscypha variabilis F]